jgi:hypothetical protein
MPYLRNKNRIRPPILHRHILRRAVHNPHTLQAPLAQHSSHIGMRLDSKNLKPLLASSQRFSEFARASSQVDNSRTALACYTTLLEEVLDGLGWVGGPVSVVGGGVRERGLGYGAEGRHFFALSCWEFLSFGEGDMCQELV